MKAIQVFAPGPPDALQYVDAPTPAPGADRVLVCVEAIGVTFIDVYHRSGVYPMPLPFIPGSEAAGVVVDTGERVAWPMVPGAYAEYALVPRERLVPLPARVDSKTAAACMLQGMTAHYLVTSTFVVRPGTTALIHAAAGGAGGLLVQMARQRGARAREASTLWPPEACSCSSGSPAAPSYRSTRPASPGRAPFSPAPA